MSYPKRLQRLGTIARAIPEIAEIHDEIKLSLKESSRLSSQKSKKTEKAAKRKNPPKDLHEIALLNKQMDKQLHKRFELEARANRIISELTEFVWCSDNPNIVDLRNELLVTIKLIKNQNGKY